MTATNTEKVGIISHVERLGLNVYGNPYYCVHFEDGTYNRTKTNSVIGFEIENADLWGVEVRVSLTNAGRIYDIKAA